MNETNKYPVVSNCIDCPSILLRGENKLLKEHLLIMINAYEEIVHSEMDGTTSLEKNLEVSNKAREYLK